MTNTTAVFISAERSRGDLYENIAHTNVKKKYSERMLHA
jgi:hypothetical protein